MKYTKRLLAAVMAFAMVSAIAPMSAFADTEIKPDTVPPEGGLTVKYDVDPSYTVTIPAGVDITTGDKTASITLNEGALLAEGSKIEVVLEKGAYTTTGNAFTAKTESGNSSASYQINGGDVKVGDVVASLDKDTLSADLTFSRTETTKPTFAGTHSEVLTFNIAVEDAVTAPTIADAFENGSTTTIIIPTFTGNNTITFTNNNGTYNIGSKSLNPYILDSVSVTPDGDKLVIRVYSSRDRDSFSVTLDKSDNSYSVWDSGYYEVNKVTSLVINETEIIDTVSKK